MAIIWQCGILVAVLSLQLQLAHCVPPEGYVDPSNVTALNEVNGDNGKTLSASATGVTLVSDDARVMSSNTMDVGMTFLETKKIKYPHVIVVTNNKIFMKVGKWDRGLPDVIRKKMWKIWITANTGWRTTMTMGTGKTKGTFNGGKKADGGLYMWGTLPDGVKYCKMIGGQVQIDQFIGGAYKTQVKVEMNATDDDTPDKC